MAIIGGTSGNDTRVGTKFYDTISTANGNDIVFALQGNDTVFGGNGNDTAFGGDGRDWLFGAAGRDSLVGDADADRLDGGEGNDNMNGGTGGDTLWGGNGADNLWGGDDRDSVFGGAGNDLVGGGSGDDLLTGGLGNDSLRGLDGTDTAVFSGAIDGYAIVRAGGLITVTDTDTTNGNDGTDRLVDVERLQFADRTVTLKPLDLDVVVGNFDGVRQELVNQGGSQGGAEGSFGSDGNVVDLPGQSLTTNGAALGDLDGDGDLDMLLATDSGYANQVLVNKDGSFTDILALPGDTRNTYAVALGDVDRDGDLDAVLGDSRSSRLLVNQGGDDISFGNDEDVVILPGAGYLSAYAVALGDVDGDGDLDALVATGKNTNNFLLLNRGVQDGIEHIFGNDGDVVTLPGGTPDTYAIALGDLDLDGDLDALLGTGSAEANQLLVNQGFDQGGNEGDFALGATVPGGTLITYAVALGDIDGDGDLDAVLGKTSVPNQLLVNQGGQQGGVVGSFGTDEDVVTLPGGSQSTVAVALGDIDGDGDLDLLVGNNGQENRLLLNRGGLQGGREGDFGTDDDVITLPGGALQTRALALGDLDGDGTGGLTANGLPWLGDGLAYANETTLLG